jgi:hypothetical protein
MRLFRFSLFIAVCLAAGVAISDIGPALIQATSIELGSAGTTDTTITRSGAGAVQIEGVQVLTAGSTSAAGLTSWGTADNGAAWLDGTALNLDDNTSLRFFETEANGDNYLEFIAPAAVTANSTCTLENDSSPIPDSCVGDGSDGGGGLADADYVDITVSSSGTAWNLDADVVTPTELAEAGSYAFTGDVTFDADALHIFDTNASHDLIITPGSDLAADRVLTLTTGDAARTITLSGNPTLSDWFDQSVKAAASPTFAAPTVTTLELGAAATDTTFARTGAGTATIEAKAIKTAGEQTIYLTAGAGTYPVSGGIASCASNTAFDSGSNDIFMRQCAFSATVDNALYFTIAFPKSADESVDLQVQVDWTSGTTTDATDDVKWDATAVCFSNDDAINANAFAAVDSVVDTQTAAGDILRSGRITAITPAGTWTEGDVCILRISRDGDEGTGSDDFNGTADLVGVAVYFQDNAANDN